MFWVGFAVGSLVGLILGLVINEALHMPRVKKRESVEANRDARERVHAENRNYFNNPVVKHLEKTDRRL